MSDTRKQPEAVRRELPLLLTARQDLLGYVANRFGRAVLLAITATSVLAVLLIFAFILKESLPYFTRDASSFHEAVSNSLERIGALLGSTQWYPQRHHPEFGALALVFGSLLVTGGAMLFAVPVALLTAVFLSDIVSFRVRQVVKPIVEILAAIPSVAYGFFAIMVVAPWMQHTLGLPTGANALNASLLLAVMALPTIISVAEDSLTSLGRELREASYALGATRSETILKVVLPAAHNGIFAAILLGIMRAVGETMVVWMASGNASKIPTPWWDLTESVRTLTATIAGDMGEAPVGSEHRHALFALGLLLLVFTFALNLSSERLLGRIRRANHTPRAMKKRRRTILPVLPRRSILFVTDAIRNAVGRVNVRLRMFYNHCFTFFALLSVALITTALLTILIPILHKGAGAVVFRGTVEFRKMQLEEFGHGNFAEVADESARTDLVRQEVYRLLDAFGRGIDPEPLQKEIRHIYREYKRQLDGRDVDRPMRLEWPRFVKRLRNALDDAYETTDPADANESLNFVLSHAEDPRIHGTVATRYVRMAREYQEVIRTVDLSRRPEYRKKFQEVRDILRHLLGPRPGDKRPALAQDRYGATRWDRSENLLERLFWVEEWVDQGPGQPKVQVRHPREKDFAGTSLASLFPRMRNHSEAMLLPRTTWYWRYFTDPATPGHYFGGVGPEIVGTLLITLCALGVALPLGVISAAYLVEATREGRVVRVIRTCVNSLAGVPSIVFGLFGLAFFVLWFLPKFGLASESSILAGSLTLALLILPVIIRASEEAIRSVPASYREAALSVGAGRFRCFLTVILPAATPGILTGTILGVSRAAGETAPIIFTAAVAYRYGFPGSILEPTQTLSYSSYDMAVGDRIAAMVPHNQFGMVAMLVLLVLLLNGAAIVVRSRISRRLRGQ
ncbi:MAG: phosphate ABC transporter permease subunit PstC [Phycisphaerae bacterium]|nr:phosphate ABC transporter permease subunit PstC [Phycisphaerae bacterium]